MIVKLIGVAHKCGEYQGRQYDKLQLYFTKPCTSDESAGEEVVTPRSTYFPTNKVPSLTNDVKSFHDFFQHDRHELLTCHSISTLILTA